jgi:ribosomal protection tetracycline resistance protein
VAKQELNLGILAHVDAGKTTLTERLLYEAGAIDEIGSVDDGTTQTDTLALERQRGITIKSAVAAFAIADVQVNLIDTPGHPEFIAEVERVLSVLDGAVVVVSGVEGVQPQTRILMRALQRLGTPTLLFVNKMDRTGADAVRVLASISQRLSDAIVAVGPSLEHDPGLRARLAELLAERDDSILSAYVQDPERVPFRALRSALADQTRRALVHPVFFGSAVTGAGVGALMDGIAELLPVAAGAAGSPVSGAVFKVERGAAGEKIAYVRMFSGRIQVRDRVGLTGGLENKITAIEVFERGPAVRRSSVSAGAVARVWGLTDVQIGDRIGEHDAKAPQHHFPPPTLETLVVPSGAGADRLRTALAQLAEQDPLIDVRQDDTRREISVSLYGEVQKEVIQATLADEFGVEATFRETTMICVERPAGTGAWVERMREPPNPFLATIGLRVEPAAIGSGVEFRIEAELGSMPLAFFRAVEDTMREALLEGLHGWEVTDVTVTMTHTGYMGKHGLGHQYFNKSISSTGEDFRKLTPYVLMKALERAETTVCEPVHRFHLDAPADVLGTLLPALTRLHAVPRTQVTEGDSASVEGDIPAAYVHELRRRLPVLTRGEGVVECTFDRFLPVTGAIPSRPRTTPNPLDFDGYVLQLSRQVVRR